MKRKALSACLRTYKSPILNGTCIKRRADHAKWLICRIGRRRRPYRNALRPRLHPNRRHWMARQNFKPASMRAVPYAAKPNFVNPAAAPSRFKCSRVPRSARRTRGNAGRVNCMNRNCRSYNTPSGGRAVNVLLLRFQRVRWHQARR